jgi:PUA-domain protein
MAVKIKNRHRLKDREVKELSVALQAQFGDDFFKGKVTVDTGSVEEYTVLLVNDSMDFFMYNNQVMFTLQGLMKHHPNTKYVVVDMGAVGFIIKGADVMTPGITDVDIAIQKNDFVWVCDEKHRKPLAIGIALISGEEMKNKQPGKAIKTIQYVGDRFWMLTH